MTVTLAATLVLAGLPLVGGLTYALGAGGSAAVTYVASFVVAIGVLIFIHELGHFAVAKAVGVGVERFSLGFGPRLWSLRRGETEYCISVVPLGGYVKMVGEEASGEEAIHPATATPAEARVDPRKSFVLKPLWARALIVFAGPAMNFVLAGIIFCLIFLIIGVPVLPSEVGRALPDSAAAQAGLALGDRIAAVDGRPVQHWAEVEEQVARSEGRPLTFAVVRDGVRRDVHVVPRRVAARTLLGEAVDVWAVGALPYLAPVVGDARAGMPAAEAGLRSRDRIVAIRVPTELGVLVRWPVQTWDDMAETISLLPGQPIVLTLEREGRRLDVALFPSTVTERDPLGRESKLGRIGIERRQTYQNLGPARAFRGGVTRTWDLTVLTVVSLWKLLTGSIPASNIGGPLQIGIAAGQAAQEGLIPYVFLVAVISINLAVLNLLPVPMLDGGHLLFFAIEAVMGRALSVRKREIAQQIGLALLLLLMVFALGNDILRLPFIDRLFK